jgi:hypothetical protein
MNYLNDGICAVRNPFTFVLVFIGSKNNTVILAIKTFRNISSVFGGFLLRILANWRRDSQSRRQLDTLKYVKFLITRMADKQLVGKQ